MTRFVLASASPARLATLRSAGLSPDVVVSDVDEDAVLAALREARNAAGTPLTPAQAVLALARAKADAVAVTTRALVLGCDSMLEFGNEVYGKPGTAAAARERWRAMRGGMGVLHTGHWLIDVPNGRALGETSSAIVHFADLGDDEIDAYVATGEPLAVAGGFTVDGIGGPYVERIEGDFHGIVGVSLPLVRRLLAQIGTPLHSLRG